MAFVAKDITNVKSPYHTAYTKAVRTGTLNFQQKHLQQLPIGVFTLHEFVPDENGWWELLVPNTLLLQHNQLTSLFPPNNYNWSNAWKELKILNVSYNEITEIPSEIFKLEFLSSIILHHNKLLNISFTKASSNNLIHIELQNNNLEILDTNIGQCVNLQNLNISHNKLKVLPISLSNCVKLETFNAANNNLIGNLNHINFSKCINLKEFDISNNQITSIHSSLFYLPSLYRLGLRQNKINQIYINENECKQDSNLIEIYLGNNNLSEFPFDIFKLPLLKLLDLRANKFNLLNKNISSCCPLLERLDIADNNLQDLPSELSYLQNIKTIVLTGNPLMRVNKSVIHNTCLLMEYLQNKLPQNHNNNNRLNDIMGLMTNLKMDDISCKQLKLNNNNLISLPPNICKMNNLFHLELNDNKLTDLTDLKYCKQLTYLSITKNNICNIQPLLELNKLETIDLRINKIKSFNYISNQNQYVVWPRLHCLHLGYNRIVNVLPLLSIIKHTNITTLDIGNNNISEFPQCILEWKSLEVLDLSNNDLSNIPYKLGLLSKLNSLMLNGNRLRKMRSVINQGKTKRILDWLKNRIT